MIDSFLKIRGHSLYFKGLRANPVVLDLGANHGEFSRQISKTTNGEFWLYEANPELATKLSQEFEGRVCNVAITATQGYISFNLTENDEASSLFVSDKPSSYNAIITSTVSVLGVTLDDLCREISEPIIDLVKMDIEGSEVATLCACSYETLCRIGQITVEFHCDPSFGFDILEGTEEAIKRLDKLGFVVLDFSGGNRNNVLFLNRRLLGISPFQEAKWKFRLHPPKTLLSIWRFVPEHLKLQGRKLLNFFGVDSI